MIDLHKLGSDRGKLLFEGNQNIFADHAGMSLNQETNGLIYYRKLFQILIRTHVLELIANPT